MEPKMGVIWLWSIRRAVYLYLTLTVCSQEQLVYNKMVFYCLNLLDLHYLDFHIQSIHHFLRLPALIKKIGRTKKLQETLSFYSQNGQKRRQSHFYCIYSFHLLCTSNNTRSGMHLVELTTQLPAYTAYLRKYIRCMPSVAYQTYQISIDSRRLQ